MCHLPISTQCYNKHCSSNRWVGKCIYIYRLTISSSGLTNFYRCTIESILAGNCSALNRKALQRGLRLSITGGKLSHHQVAAFLEQQPSSFQRARLEAKAKSLWPFSELLNGNLTARLIIRFLNYNLHNLLHLRVESYWQNAALSPNRLAHVAIRPGSHDFPEGRLVKRRSGDLFWTARANKWKHCQICGLTSHIGNADTRTETFHYVI
jgi:hypothetical protein